MCADHGISIEDAYRHFQLEIHAGHGPSYRNLVRAIVYDDAPIKRGGDRTRPGHTQNHRSTGSGRPREWRTKLTSRETETLERLARLGRIAPVAAEMGIGRETVRTHVKCARQKLAARNVTHAVAIAIRQGLIEPPPRRPINT